MQEERNNKVNKTIKEKRNQTEKLHGKEEV